MTASRKLSCFVWQEILAAMLISILLSPGCRGTLWPVAERAGVCRSAAGGGCAEQLSLESALVRDCWHAHRVRPIQAVLHILAADMCSTALLPPKLYLTWFGHEHAHHMCGALLSKQTKEGCCSNPIQQQPTFTRVHKTMPTVRNHTRNKRCLYGPPSMLAQSVKHPAGSK